MKLKKVDGDKKKTGGDKKKTQVNEPKKPSEQAARPGTAKATGAGSVPKTVQGSPIKKK